MSAVISLSLTIYQLNRAGFFEMSHVRIYPPALDSSGTSGSPLPVLANMSEPLRAAGVDGASVPSAPLTYLELFSRAKSTL
ncbi:hypothetical protein AVEN_65682-1 [Araneus ventricosus]|uniref:Uncharacterized protein n=2 Tax=Araneus ventricosus TaxID=182803 RepID=A0A4Y2VTB0_ARAVE|nr:hypothetical protein AVEN_65682-1 [Araneus ventricosus]